jgi:serine/threonine protein kinase
MHQHSYVFVFFASQISGDFMSDGIQPQMEIGNYRIVREIDSGAFGRVYIAQHLLLKNRTVAIKLLHNTRLVSQEERDNFLREAQILEVLKHPYILPILDVGIDEGFPYLVAEYAPNGSLRDKIRHYAPNPLPVQETLTILTQIGQALYYAHQQHIIHRDIKPENILFNARGEALLADFGVATMIETASIKFATVIGTPSYMAPEQFQNSISKESDQYSLACVAYELFTGQRPFTAHDFFAMGFKHMQEAPTPPAQLNPQLPPFVEDAILRAMSKQRTDRFPDIKAFITELHLPSNSQGRLPAISTPLPAVSMPIPTVQPSEVPTARAEAHLSQAPTIASSNSDRPSQVLPATPQVAAGEQKLLSTGERERQTHPAYPDPVTPIPPTMLPIRAQLDSDPGKTTKVLPAASLVSGNSMPLPVPQTQHAGPLGGPLTPAPVEQTYISPIPRYPAPQQQQPRRRWIIILAAVLAILVLLLSGVFGSLLIFFHPTISISGSSKVVPGSTLKIQGSGFVPGMGISLTLDDGAAIAYMGSDAMGEAWFSDAATATAFQSYGGYYQTMLQDPLSSTLTANSTGSFAITIYVNDLWALGVHTIHAAAGIWSAQAEFTVVPKTPQITVSGKVLDFGKVGMGVQPTLSIVIGNSGGARLIWSAQVNNAPWLKLQKNTGIIEPGSPQQTINVTADTRALKEGSYSGVLLISSNGGDAQVQVKLQVGPQHNGSLLDVNPGSLNFGSILTNQQSMQLITIGNVGNQTLNWSADTGGTSWLQLTNSKGAVKSGAQPQSIYAIATTSNLTPGSYGGTITIHSNGGTASLNVSLTVVGPTQTPPPPGITPTPTHAPRPTPTPTHAPRPTPTPTHAPTPTPTPPPSPTPTPTSGPLGGTWISPGDNFVVASGTSLHFSAHAYGGVGGVNHVNFTITVSGQNAWFVGCQAFSPTPGTTDVYECNWNLTNGNGNPMPPGAIQVSFDVYDQAHNRILSANGFRNGTIT